jgi:hypothetical protein
MFVIRPMTREHTGTAGGWRTMDLLAWWNLIFLLPALAALLYLLLLASGAVPDDDVEADADVDADLDTEVDTDVEHGIEHSLGGQQDHQAPGVADLLGFIGFGRVPLSILVMSLCFLWGFAGWAANRVIDDLLGSPARFFWLAIPVAAVTAIGGTRYLARGLARIMPATESYGVSQRDLVGRLARVRDTVTEHHGRAQLFDDRGTLHEVPCRIRAGEAAVPQRTEVLLLSFDRDKGVYYVLADPLGDSAEK